MKMPVKCPHCGKITNFEGNPFRPFCSERCKLIDLGAWVSGTYRIPTENKDEGSNIDSEDSAEKKDSDQK
jgi:endogenous inhibitor of DNA gyrase (YacG/DUF329 family)